MKNIRQITIYFFIIFTIFSFLVGCGKKIDSSALGQSAVNTAEKYIGTPYIYGGRTPKGFDCSGFVWYVYQQHGVKLPQTSWKQADYGQKISKGEIAPGDLVFFQSKGRVHHVGLYIGKGQMIHAPGKGKKVTKVDINEKYYRNHYATARRINR